MNVVAVVSSLDGRCLDSTIAQCLNVEPLLWLIRFDLRSGERCCTQERARVYVCENSTTSPELRDCRVIHLLLVKQSADSSSLPCVCASRRMDAGSGAEL